MINRRTRNIPPSSTLALNALAKKMQQEGKDVINLTAGEPDFPTPTNIITATQKALADGATRYTPVAGIPELRQAVAQASSKEYGCSFAPNQVIITNGAKQALSNFLQTVLEEGDEVIVPTPYWASYPHMITAANGRTVLLELSANNDFLLQPEELSKALTAKTKAILINSPSNPTGALQPRENLQAVVSMVKGRSIYLLFDDIYQHLTFDNRTWVSPFSLEGVDPEYTVAFGSVSKSYAMTGFRIGWALGPPEVIDAMIRLQSHTTSNAATSSQWAALQAVTGSQESVETMRLAFEQRRNLVVQALEQIPGVRCSKIGGAFYAFPDVSACLHGRWPNTHALATHLLEEALVATVPGEAFGKAGHLRISFAASEELLKQGLVRIATTLS